MAEFAAPQLPPVVLYTTTLLFLVIHCLVLRRIPGLLPKFVVTAIWLRFMLSAHHHLTFAPIVAGRSITSLFSICVVAVGVTLIAKRYLLLRSLMPIYGLLLIILVSALVNGTYGLAIGVIVKWGYFLVILLALVQSTEYLGPQRLFPILLTVFIPPLGFQVLSVLLGVSKDTDVSGATAFIGGFFHESAFSITILTCLFLTTVTPGLRPALRFGLAFLSIASLILVNYRTMQLAAAPLIVAFFLCFPLQLFKVRDRALILVASIWPLLFVALAAFWLLQERFSDLGLLASSTEVIFQDPSYFTPDERRLLSARPYIWSRYLDGYSDGTDLQLLFGFGPDSWVGVFPVYAHNTLVSYLYEYGLAGVFAIIAVWIAMLVTIRRIADRSLRVRLFAAHVSFFIANMATMPHWILEGVILYALICGVTLSMAIESYRSAHGLAGWRQPYSNRVADGR